jgi:hypothetical protein
MTPSGIEPATFRFVAQYLNDCATISGSLAKYRGHVINEQNNVSGVKGVSHTFLVSTYAKGIQSLSKIKVRRMFSQASLT